MTKLGQKQLLMRIFIGEGDRYLHKPLYEALVELLHAEGLSGATVLRGVCGFGGHRRLHSQKLLDISADLPLVVEVVDSEQKLESVMPRIEAMMEGGMITLEKVTAIRYNRD
jgi:PII-like signaling protein